MDIARITKHLFFSDLQVARAFSRQSLKAIEAAVQASETTHAGEICFAVEGGLDGLPLFKGQSARERAIDVFSQLRVWDTEHNNGVLIYLLLADRDFEILADRGIHQHLGRQEWARISHEMEMLFKQGEFEQGVLHGIRQINMLLVRHYPASLNNHNELPNAPVII